MRISDWSSDVCSSDLYLHQHPGHRRDQRRQAAYGRRSRESFGRLLGAGLRRSGTGAFPHGQDAPEATRVVAPERDRRGAVHGEPSELLGRSEEHTSELQSLMRISYAVFCLKKKTENNPTTKQRLQKT